MTPPLYAVVVFLWYGAGMSAIEFSGVEQTFSQLEGERKVFEWVFQRDGEPVDIADVIFDGVVVFPDGSTVPVDVQHVSNATGALTVSFPPLEPGTYEYEVRYSSAAGALGRVVFGRIGVESSALVLDELEGIEREKQTLVLKLPAEAGGQLLLEWRASSLLMAAADRAQAAADKLKGVDETLDRLALQMEEFRMFTVRWHEDIVSILVMNPVTGTIWVDGVDTGEKYRGEDGKAPRINAYGFWEVYEQGEWRTLPYQAIGKDGIDGDKIKRYLTTRDAQGKPVLPAEGERGVFYYVPSLSGDGYDMWGWMENAGWVCLGKDPYDFASTDSPGLVLLATDAPLAETDAPVGMDTAKRLRMAQGTTTVPGAMKPSSDEVSDRGGGTHFSVSGSLLTDVATVLDFGSVRLSTNLVLENGGIVGMNSEGQLIVQVATPDRPGAVRPGSRFEQLEEIPYIVAVGVDRQGRLANCLVRGGALKHMQPKYWSGNWIEEGAFPTDGAHYLGLFTSEQFDQSRANGLELKAATSNRLAGVCVSEGPEDIDTENGEPKVPQSRDVAWKEQVYSKEKADERFMQVKGNCVSVVVCEKGQLPKPAEMEKGVLYLEK